MSHSPNLCCLFSSHFHHESSADPHLLQMLDDGKVGIKIPLHAVLRTTLLAPIEFSILDRPRHAFLPAHVREVVNSYRWSVSSSLHHPCNHSINGGSEGEQGKARRGEERRTTKGGHTLLHLGLLHLVCDELLELSLILWCEL